MTIEESVSTTQDSIQDALTKIGGPPSTRTPEQQENLKKTWELAQEFENYISKWMALESMTHIAKGLSHTSFLSAMAEALSASLTKMVVVAGWNDEIALSAFASSLRDYRKTLTEQYEKSSETANG